MDGRPTWTDCEEAGDYVVPNVLSPRDLVLRPDNMYETVPLTCSVYMDFRYAKNTISYNRNVFLSSSESDIAKVYHCFFLHVQHPFLKVKYDL